MARPGPKHRYGTLLFALGLLTPGRPAALAVGDIVLRSGLNQYLEAEIPLVLAAEENLEDIRVSLASAADFEKAGLDRPYFLSKLQFRPIRLPDGSQVIRVSSRETIREPFLDFLVEVVWPQGRTVREYTVLLDPPTERPGAAAAGAPLESAPRFGPDYPRSGPVERAAEIGRYGATPPPVRRHRRSIEAFPDTGGKAPEPEPAVPPAVLPPPEPGQLTGQSYGPIRRGQTLRGIAEAGAGDLGVTPAQLAVGLFRANRHAFRGNINTLQAGATLRVPTREFLEQLDPTAAREEFARLLGARSVAWAPAAQQGGGEPRLRLLPAPPSAAETPAAPASSAALDSLRQENEAYRGRIQQLEQRLGDLQRLLTLKDQQIASLESRVSMPPLAEAAPPQPIATPIPTPAAPSVAPTSAPVASAPEAPVISSPPPPPPVTPRPTPPPPPAAIPEEGEGPVDLLALGVASGILLLGLALWLLKRRRDALLAQAERPLPVQREPLRPTAEGTPKKSRDATAETSFAPTPSSAVFAPEYLESWSENDPVDPVVEADVYLAYGRNEQAEALIRHAIAQNPGRHDFKLKLLDIFQVTDDREGFADYVRELRAARLDQEPDFWQQVASRIRDFQPDLARLAGPEAAEPAAAAAGAEGPRLATASGPEVVPDGAAGPVPEWSFPVLSVAETVPSSETTAAGAYPAAPAEAAPEPGEGEADGVKEDTHFIPFDFDLGASVKTPQADGGDVDATEDADGRGGTAAHPIELSDLQIDLSAEPESDDDPLDLAQLLALQPDSAEEPPVLRLDAGEDSADQSIDDILRELTASLEQLPREVSSGSAAPSAAVPPLDFAAPPAGGVEEPELPDLDEELLGDLTDMDPYETKLDLAKAYQEMGDDQAARTLLEDVAAHGNAGQQAEAQKLLGQSPGGRD